MKKVLCIFALVIFLSATAFAGITLPANKSVAKAGGGFTSDLKIGPEGVGNVMSVAVPISSLQKGNVQIYMSVAKAVGDGWVEVTQPGNYAVVTKTIAGFGVAELNFENGTYRIRLWAKIGDQWLHINKASAYFRLDSKKTGAYEFIISTGTGESMPVPTDYYAWQ